MFKKNYLMPQLSRDIIINVLGTILVGFVGLIFYILVARFLGPAQFGLFSVAAAVLVISADIFDLGTNTGIIKFIAEAISQKNFERVGKIAKFALVFKLFVGGAILACGFLISKPLALLIFNQPELAKVLLLAFGGVVIILLLGFFTSILQAFKKFFLAVFINLAANLLRLIILVILAFSGKINIQTTMAVFSLTPIFGVLLGWINLPLKFLKTKIDRQLAFQFLSFNKWVALGFILSVLQVRLPNFLLIRFSDTTQTGLFGAASTLTLFAPQITAALSITLAPRFSQIKNFSELKINLKNSFLITAFFAFLTLLLVPFARLILNVTVGEKFLEATASFQILIVASAFLILTVTQLATIIYSWSQPKIYTILSAIQLLIMILANIFLIPKMGALGASFSFLLATLVGFLFISGYFLIKWQKQSLSTQ